MREWKAASEISKELNALGGLLYAFLGVCIWEGFNLFVLFDVPVLTRKIKVKPTVIPYFIAKLSVFLYLTLTLTVWLASQGKGGNSVNCRAVTWAAIIFKMLTIISSTTLALIRATNLSTHRRLAFSLSGLAIVILTVLYIPALIHNGGYTFTVNIVTGKISGLCTSVGVTENYLWSGAIYAYSFALNIIAAIYSTYAAIRINKSLEPRKKQTIRHVLSKNGLVFMYFIQIMYILLVTGEFLNLNGTFRYLFNIPCILLISICSCRLVIHLHTYHQYGGLAFFPERTRQTTGLGVSKNSRISQHTTLDKENRVKLAKDGEGNYYEHDNKSSESPLSANETNGFASPPSKPSVASPAKAEDTLEVVTQNISYLSPTSAARPR